MRPLFTQLRTQWATDRLQPPDPAGPSPQDAQLDAALSGDQPPARPEASAVPEVSASSAQPGAAPDRNPTPALPACHAQNNVPLQASACDLPVRAASSSCLPPRARAAVPQLVSHAGVLLFAPVLSTLREALATYPRLWPLVKLVLTCVWLGAVNLEQSKLLHRPSLKFLLGTRLFTRDRLRRLLNTLAADPAVPAAVFAANLSLTPPEERAIFYFDPHGKEYTGAKKILKGYFTSLHGTRKVVHADFFHTRGGRPVYFEHSDNFADMRDRFREVLPRFRALLGVTSEQSLTFVMDRAIFSHAIFDYFLAPDSPNHLITWEKWYHKGQFVSDRATQDCVLTRPRNHRQDLLRYAFRYYEEAWSKRPAIRRILVRAVAPGKHEVEMAILCTDPTRSAEEVITLMFSRWVQENDFSYLIEHFGLDQLIAYRAISFDELRALITDRDVKSVDYKVALAQKQTAESELQKLLLKQHTQQRPRAALHTAIDAKTREVDEFTQAMQTTQQEESRLERLVEESYCRLDTSSKTLMDAIKILAHNIFYLALAPFREQYDNYRDDHTLFRHLSRCPGIAWSTDDQVSVVLMPDMHLPRKTRQVVEDVLALINAQDPVMPDGSDKRIQLLLAPKTGKRSALKEIVAGEPDTPNALERP